MNGDKETSLIFALGAGVTILLPLLLIILFLLVYQRRLYKKQKLLNQLELEKQKTLMDAFILTKEKEQKRIAQELHDGIGSSLTALKMSLIHIEMDNNDKVWINERIKAISHDVKRISNELMPSMLEDMGLQATVTRLVENLNKSTKVSFRYSPCDVNPYAQNPQTELALYRVIQEILTNIIKYADASNVLIRETILESIYNLQIIDDGKGFSPTETEFSKSGSLGLKNIKSRILQIGGTLNYLSNLPKGTIVNIEISLNGKS